MISSGVRGVPESKDALYSSTLPIWESNVSIGTMMSLMLSFESDLIMDPVAEDSI